MSPNSSPIISFKNSWAIRMADSVLRDYPKERWIWHYEHGLFVKSILELGITTGEARYAEFASNWIDHFITPDGGILTFKLEDYNLDQINSGKVLFPFYKWTNERRYAQALGLLREQLRTQPRTANGGFWHKKIYPYQIWLDGLYMAGPFGIEYALTFNESALISDIIHQFVNIFQNAHDPKTGLLYHAWDEKRKQKWANPLTGCSPNFWGRAMGWYTMALVDILDLLPVVHVDRTALLEILESIASALVRFQDTSSGLWYQVLDGAGRPGNYREASVSAMLSYSFARAARKGYLASDFLAVARRAYHGLLENMIKVDSSGVLTLEGTCNVAGLGGTPYRDGSYEYYISEKTAANDFKGVGPFILAALEMELVGVEKAS